MDPRLDARPGVVATDRVRGRTLLEIFETSVMAHPDRVAIDAFDSTLTYRELDQRVAELGMRLAAVGVGRGSRVGVWIPSGTSELYVAILGVLSIGATYVPVDRDDPDQRAIMAWADADVEVVVHAGLLIKGRGSIPAAPAAPSPDDEAWVIFTSGSTGRPKGVAVTHRSAAALVEAEARLFDVREEDRVLAGLSVGFDASCEEMWLAWRSGAALVPAPRQLVRSGSELGPWLTEHAVSVVSTVPTLASLWDDDDLGGVRLIILGGEACPDALGWKLAAGREVWNTYGPTETTVVTTAARVQPGLPVTIGRPLEGWLVSVIGPEGEPVVGGEVGELVIGGVGLGRYLDPELDRERFAPLRSLGWRRAYRTGDLVREGRQGLEYLGRRDDQVKMGGRRVELGEIDHAVASVPGVRRAATVVRSTAAGDRVLVCYVVAETAVTAIREHLVDRLPSALLPRLVPLERLPMTSSGKVDSGALPWPPPADRSELPELTATEAWLAALWERHLGVRPQRLDDDFFDLGGGSLLAAKLASDLRARFPSAAVADVYSHRTVAELAARLDELATTRGTSKGGDPGLSRPGRGVGQAGGVGALLALTAPGWVVGVLAYNDVVGDRGLPTLGWAWLCILWLALVSGPGRVVIVALARRLLLPDLAPGRYSRRSSLATRVWLVDRLADIMHLAQYGGTPSAATVARLCGTRVAKDARLGVIPSPASLVTIGSGATIEADVDLHGWWIDGRDMVIGPVTVGDHARVGTRAVLLPGATVGPGAEVDAGSVITDEVPAGERWGGAPAVGLAPSGQRWPDAPAPRAHDSLALRAAFASSLLFTSFLPVVAFAPGECLLLVLGSHVATPADVVAVEAAGAPVLAATFAATYAIVVALLVRALRSLIRPGWHGPGRVTWALWTSEHLLAGTRVLLFPLYSSLLTRPWLRLMGVRVGRRTEISTTIGLGPLVDLGAAAFIADDVVFNTGRSRNGWLHLDPVSVGNGAFCGNGALVNGGTRLEPGTLVGVQSTPPGCCPSETSWFGVPAIEFPRVPAATDRRRTVDPPARLVAARAVVETLRIVGPLAASIALASGVFWVLESCARGGAWTMVLAAPFVLAAAGVVAAGLTVLVKWILMGCYRAEEHPLWSWYVWRDEIINACQEVLAGLWLVDLALGTPVMSAYLRAMGANVGRDVWCDTLTITEFDLVTLDDGCAVNRRACVETHLFHDRIMSTGPIHIGREATVGPSTAVLPDTDLGERCVVAARSVVLRGERLPDHTSWLGAPVTAW